MQEAVADSAQLAEVGHKPAHVGEEGCLMAGSCEKNTEAVRTGPTLPSKAHS